MKSLLKKKKTTRSRNQKPYDIPVRLDRQTWATRFVQRPRRAARGHLDAIPPPQSLGLSSPSSSGASVSTTACERLDSHTWATRFPHSRRQHRAARGHAIPPQSPGISSPSSIVSISSTLSAASPDENNNLNANSMEVEYSAGRANAEIDLSEDVDGTRTWDGV